MERNVKKRQWCNIIEKFNFSKPEQALEWAYQEFFALVDVILTGEHYEKLPDPDAVRFEHLREANQEYQECVTFLKSVIEKERSGKSETPSIDTIRQTSCEKAG